MARETIADVKRQHKLVVDRMTKELAQAEGRIQDMHEGIQRTLREQLGVKESHRQISEQVRHLERHNALLTGFLLAKVTVEDIPIDVYQPANMSFVP